MSLIKKRNPINLIKISNLLFYFLIISLILLNLYDITYHLLQEGSLNLHQATEAIILFLITILVIFIKIYNIYGWNQLNDEIHKKNQEIDIYKTKYKESIQEIKKGIKEQFHYWELTKEEAKVAQYLILGYSFKQIAGLLQKSEKTIRNQSLSIYKKTGMIGRNDLAGFFLYDFFEEE